jgi:AcrR family transcriptional regulator
MSPTRAYRPRRRARSTGTRERIVAAVGELLEEGAFHEATVEEVADRAGVARATLYQHFGSRLGLVDAICETIADSPELRAAKGAGELEDADVALAELVGSSVRFWASHERMLAPLYGVAAVDPAAARLVERQRRDRTSVLGRFARRLRRERRLRASMPEQRALALLLVLTSFETYLELRRHAGLAEREVVRTLHAWARSELLADG